MIVSILPGSPNFHAVGYNEHKVSKGNALLIEMKNIDIPPGSDKISGSDIVRFLQDYSSRNARVCNPQLHVSFSCKGKEMTYDELRGFAHEWLREMGYDNEGQPLLIYAHTDTDNNHVHIITSRINPQGKKINDSNERRRSQIVIDKIIKKDRKEKVNQDVETAKGYQFSSIAQFKAILNSMGYEAYSRNSNLMIKFGGTVRMEIPEAEISALETSKERDRALCRRLRQYIMKYKESCASMDELKKALKEKFGLDIILYGKENDPIGYMLVDHKNKTVINGNRVMALDQLRDFTSFEDLLQRLDEFVDRQLSTNPKITTRDLNKILMKKHTCIRRGVYHVKGVKIPLMPHMADVISENDRIYLVEQFNPTTQAEVDILCSIFNINNRDKVAWNDPSDPRSNNIGKFPPNPNQRSPDDLKNDGYRIRKDDGGNYYAINFNTHDIVSLNPDAMKQVLHSSARKIKSGSNSNKRLPHGKVSATPRGDNREWEVGTHTDESQLSGKLKY